MCDGHRKKEIWNTEKVDQWLINNSKSFVRNGIFEFATKKSRWKCLECEYEWEAKFSQIIYNNTGCPCCRKKILTNKKVDIWLFENHKNIMRLDNIKSGATKIKWKCLDCNYEWEYDFYTMKYSNYGCPICENRIITKFTADHADKWLIQNNKPIIRFGEFTAYNKHTEWKCLNCGKHWITSFASLKNANSGCPHCAGNARITNQFVDQWLIQNNKSIKRIKDIKNSRNHITWECLICSYQWDTSFDNIKTKITQCPQCDTTNNYSVDKFLLENNKSIKRLDKVYNTNTSYKWECLICFHKWTTKFSHIKHNNSMCPKCSIKERITITNDSIDKILLDENRQIKRIDNIIDSSIKIKWMCLVDNCKHIWQTSPRAIKDGSGCSKCAGNYPLDNDNMDQFLKKYCPLIKRLGEVKNAKDKIDWECLQCGYIWKTKPNHIRCARSKCPLCSKGFTNERLVFSFFKENKINFEYHVRVSHNYCIGNFFDFYLPDLNLFIEYNGEQHYRPVRFNGMAIERANEMFIKQQQRDSYVRDYCKENNFKLLEIDGRTFVNHKLTEFLKEYFLENK